MRHARNKIILGKGTLQLKWTSGDAQTFRAVGGEGNLVQMANK